MDQKQREGDKLLIIQEPAEFGMIFGPVVGVALLYVRLDLQYHLEVFLFPQHGIVTLRGMAMVQFVIVVVVPLIQIVWVGMEQHKGPKDVLLVMCALQKERV